MKLFINLDDFMKYLNQEKLSSRTPDVAEIKVVEDDFDAFLTLKSKQRYTDTYTVEFMLKFEHDKHIKGGVFQRKFSIEHHPEEKSTHTKPHVQLHIHGPASDNKVGKAWITLPLENEDEYSLCIKGFFFILEKVIKKCEPGLEKFMLNVEEVEKLAEQKTFLLEKINQSLNANGIEYQSPDGKKILLTPKNISQVLKKDATLLPFFESHK